VDNDHRVILARRPDASVHAGGTVREPAGSMATQNDKRLERRVVAAAEAALAERQFVTAIDVLLGLGWLPASGEGLDDDEVLDVRGLRRERREREALRRAAEDVEMAERFAGRIAELFPGCPATRAQAIARHAAAHGSGRVGRSAAGRALEDRAVELAVSASIRHQDTGYDELLMAGVERDDARERVRDEADAVLDRWRQR
jgi:hypothetical protein